MTVSKKDTQLVILLSGIIIVIPMVVFPAKLGIDISTGSFSYAIVEVLWYAAVFFLMRSQSSILQIFQAAGLTFLYRIVVGTIFGLFLSIMYGVGISASLSLGVSRYFPAILLHIISAPFIVKSFYLAILGEGENESRPRLKPHSKDHKEESVIDQPYFNRQDKGSERTATASADPTARANASGGLKTAEAAPDVVFGQDQNGFERAVRYLGEQGAIKLAAVVDHEGLTMATYRHSDIDPDLWTPLAELFKERNIDVLNRNYQAPGLQRIDLYLEHERIFILAVDRMSIIVVSNREDDELVGVRLHQAAEMVRKYVSERYGKLMSAGTEEKYVSSTRRTE